MLGVLLLALGAWGPSGCPAVVGPRFVPAPAFIAPAPVVMPAPAPVSWYRNHLARRAQPGGRGGVSPPNSKDDCLPDCGCKRCDDGCDCVAGKGSCGPGCKCISAEKVISDEAATQGVDFSKVGKGCDRARYTRGGRGGVREVTRAEAERLVTAPSLPDDATKPWLVVVLPDAERKAAEAQYASAPEFAAYRGKFRLQSFAPEHWYVSHKKFQPGVTVMLPDGSLAKHLSSWDAAEVAKALYRASPDYDPKKDPDAKHPAPHPAPGPDASPSWEHAKPYVPCGCAVLSALGVVMLFRKEKKEG